MSSFTFRKTCAVIVTVAYSHVFICSPCEASTISNFIVDDKTHGSVSKDNGTNLMNGYLPRGKWDIPGTISTEDLLIGLGAVALLVALIFIAKSSEEEKTTNLDGLDSVLTPPASLNLARPHPLVADSLATFTTRLSADSEQTILDGKVSMTYEHYGWRPTLSFKNIIGVARDLDGPFEQTSLEIEKEDVFYVQVKTLIVYRVHVVQDRLGVTLTFDEM